MFHLVVVAAALVSPGSGRTEPPVSDTKADVFGKFVGSTPCGEPFGRLFDIPADANPPVRWALTLYRDPKTKVPTVYELRAEYDGAKPAATRKSVTRDKEGRWSVGKGTKADPQAVVLELAGAVNFLKPSDDILHALNPDRTLAVGTAGWSYTLNRAAAAEKVVVPSAEWLRGSESYKLSPLASGPDVFGVFEGRTPAQGIARDLKIDTEPNRFKVKWRVTLYQNPETKAPTTYKVESSFHREARREGTWSVVKGEGGEGYHLAAAKAEPALRLRRGDDNVLFFLGANHEPKVGNEDFSYTLNRRAPASGGR
jgi:hypothetical protein